MSGLRWTSCLLAGVIGCASGSGDLERVRVENELLREELRIVKRNCSYYREVEMQAEEEEPEDR